MTKLKSGDEVKFTGHPRNVHGDPDVNYNPEKHDSLFVLGDERRDLRQYGEGLPDDVLLFDVEGNFMENGEFWGWVRSDDVEKVG